MEPINLPVLIKTGRERAGISKSALAKLVGVSPAAVTYWEEKDPFPQGLFWLK